jgi:hypothetical protein
MTPLKMCLLLVTVAALTFGHTGSELKPTHEQLPITTQYVVLAADEPQESGTHTGDEAATPCSRSGLWLLSRRASENERAPHTQTKSLASGRG